VESAIADKRHMIVEAGTRTENNLTYLVPALLSGKHIIVSTGTRNLRRVSKLYPVRSNGCDATGIGFIASML
jgi:hypothetical protein